jgi:hypothetical protein
MQNDLNEGIVSIHLTVQAYNECKLFAVENIIIKNPQQRQDYFLLSLASSACMY